MQARIWVNIKYLEIHVLRTPGESLVARRRPPFKKSGMLMLAGLSVFILYLYFFVGFGDILEVMKEVNLGNYLIYYSLALVAVTLSTLFYSITWLVMLNILSVEMRLRKSFYYCWVGNFVDLIVPFETISGEITRIYLATRNSTGHVGKIVASVAGHRIVSAIVLLFGLTVSSTLLAFGYRVEQLVLSFLMIVQIGTIASILMVLYLSLSRKAAKRIVDFLLRAAHFIFGGRFRLTNLREKSYRALDSFYQGVMVLRSQPKALIIALVSSSAAWALHFAVYILVFTALGFDVSIDVSLIVYSVSIAIQYLPIALPLGLVEIVMASLYNLFGIPLAVGGTATAFIRIITFWFQVIVGYAIAQWIGMRSIAEPK